VGQLPEALGLSLGQSRITLGVVANKHFAERRLKKFNVFCEVVAKLKVKFVLSALLGRARRHKTIRCGVAQNGGAKLFIYQNAGPFFGHTRANGGFEAVVDHLLGSCDFRGLLRCQIAMPAEHFCYKRASVIERQDVEALVKTGSSHDVHLISRKRRMRLFVEVICRLLSYRCSPCLAEADSGPGELFRTPFWASGIFPGSGFVP